jgi:hypothetical protein
MMYWVIEFSNKSIPLWSQRIFAVNYDYFTLRSEGDYRPFAMSLSGLLAGGMA